MAGDINKIEEKKCHVSIFRKSNTSQFIGNRNSKYLTEKIGPFLKKKNI